MPPHACVHPSHDARRRNRKTNQPLANIRARAAENLNVVTRRSVDASVDESEYFRDNQASHKNIKLETSESKRTRYDCDTRE